MSRCCSRPPAILSSERVIRSIRRVPGMSRGGGLVGAGGRAGAGGGTVDCAACILSRDPARAEWNTVIERRGSVGILIRFLSPSGFVSELFMGLHLPFSCCSALLKYGGKNTNTLTGAAPGFFLFFFFWFVWWEFMLINFHSDIYTQSQGNFFFQIYLFIFLYLVLLTAVKWD